MNDDMHTQNTYANKMGIAGEMLSHSQGALACCQLAAGDMERMTYENPKNKAEGTTTNMPVAILMGLSREFCSRPPKQKTVLPMKCS